MKQMFIWLYHTGLEISITGITLIVELSSSANIQAVRKFTKPLFSNSTAAPLVLALIFLHLIYCIFCAGIRTSVLPCSETFSNEFIWTVYIWEPTMCQAFI